MSRREVVWLSPPLHAKRWDLPRAWRRSLPKSGVAIVSENMQTPFGSSTGIELQLIKKLNHASYGSHVLKSIEIDVYELTILCLTGLPY